MDVKIKLNVYPNVWYPSFCKHNFRTYCKNVSKINVNTNRNENKYKSFKKLLLQILYNSNVNVKPMTSIPNANEGLMTTP